MPPLDLTTLLVLAGMVVSLIAGEAAFYGDLLTLRINVAPPIVTAGVLVVKDGGVAGVRVPVAGRFVTAPKPVQ